MLSKSATIILGLINEKPLNAYEITKMLSVMNIKSWYNISNSTVYTTIKTLEKKKSVIGVIQKDGNMPNKTVFSLTPQGKQDFVDTLRQSILNFDYDTNIFSIAAFFLTALEKEERIQLLDKRLNMLTKYLDCINLQIKKMKETGESPLYIANVIRCKDLVMAEISGTKEILKNC